MLELGGLPPDYPTPLNWPAARYLEVCQVRVGERPVPSPREAGERVYGEGPSAPALSREREKDESAGYSWRAAMRVLLVTPPMTQLNTPYPATAYLTGFLRQHAAAAARGGAGRSVARAVPAAVLARRARRAVQRRAGARRAATQRAPPSIAHFLAHARALRRRRSSRSSASCRAAIPSLALRIVGRAFLPEGPRFAALDAEPATATATIRSAWAFGELGIDRPRPHLASLYVDDLADVIRDGIDPRFELSRYGEQLAASAATLRSAARRARRRRRRWSTRCSTSSRASCVARPRARRRRPDRAVPRQRLRRVPDRARVEGGAPGDAGRARRRLRQHRAARSSPTRACSTTSTSSRSTTASGRCSRCSSTCAIRRRPLLRTFVREAGAVVARSRRRRSHDVPHRDAGTPTYDGPAARSLRVAVRDAEPDAPAVVRRPLEQADGRARLLLEEVHVLRRLARLHRALRAARRPTSLVDRIEALIARDRADRLPLRRRGGAAGGAARARRAAASSGSVAITWWGNIRFEKTLHARARASCSRAPAASR